MEPHGESGGGEKWKSRTQERSQHAVNEQSVKSWGGHEGTSLGDNTVNWGVMPMCFSNG